MTQATTNSINPSKLCTHAAVHAATYTRHSPLRSPKTSPAASTAAASHRRVTSATCHAVSSSVATVNMLNACRRMPGVYLWTRGPNNPLDLMLKLLAEPARAGLHCDTRCLPVEEWRGLHAEGDNCNACSHRSFAVRVHERKGVSVRV